MRSVLYRFPDLEEFERLLSGAAAEAEFALPSSEVVEDGEWILAIFELGQARRATSAAARATISPVTMGETPKPPAQPVTMGETPKPPAQPVTMGETPKPPAQPVTMGETPKPPAQPVTMGETPKPPAQPDEVRLVFEPRDWKRLADFARKEARSAPPTSTPDPPTLPEGTAPPAAGAPRPVIASRPVAHPIPSSPRVMIVDDDPDIRDVVSAMLEAVGLVVASVESGEEALALLAEKPFDLLVLDWNLPGMTGLDLCRALRRDPELATLPVLFLTANASSQDMVNAFASGGDDYVVKPFRAPELGARIFSLLRRKRGASQP